MSAEKVDVSQYFDELRPATRAHPAEDAAAFSRYRLTLVIVALVSLGIGALLGRFAWRGVSAPWRARPELAPPPQWNQAAAWPLPTLTPAPLVVYVSGAVHAPQTLTLPTGSLVGDAIAAAGGAAPDADLEALNLAAPLAPNQHVQVPRRSTPPPCAGPAARDTTPASAPTPTGDLLNINTATAAELESLPGIGPTRAAAIIAYREEHGPFQEPAEIQEVSGIGPATYADIAPYLTVEP